MKSLKFLGAAIVALALNVVSINGAAIAGPLTGDTVNVTHYFPSLGSVNANLGNQTVPTGAFNYYDLYTIVVTADSITYSSTSSSTWSSGSFNGPVITDLTNALITGATIDASTNYTGFNLSRLTFDSSHVYFNLNSLQVGGFIKINLTGGTTVPSPASLALFGLGLVGIGGLRRKSKAA